MLGLYDNFPENYHRITSSTFHIPNRKLQEKFVQALYEMNNRAVSPEEIDQQALRECTIIFETGVAESKSFNFLDEAEFTRLNEAVKKDHFRIIDFFFAARYYKTKEGRKTPLRFDYFLVRAVFPESSVELRIFHDRGPRYMTPEDVGNFVLERIRRALVRRTLKKP